MRRAGAALGEVRRAIDRTVKEEVAKDPFGHACLLSACLENGYRSPTADFLVDWMNEWIDQVLHRGETSRELDREFGAAVLGLLVLERHGMLRQKVDETGVGRQLGQYFDDQRGFFGNFAYSAVIVRFLRKKAGLETLRERADRYVGRRLGDLGAVFNDPVNLGVWICMLGEEADPTLRRRVFQFAYTKLVEGSLHHQQRLYYALALLRLRREASRKEWGTIVTAAEEVLQGFVPPPANESALRPEEIWEHGAGESSKVALAAYLNLGTAVGRNVVVVPRERDEPLGMVRIGGLALLVVALAVLVFLLNGLVAFAGWADVAEIKTALFAKPALARLLEFERLLLAGKLVAAFGVFLAGIGALVVIGTFACCVGRNVVYRGTPYFLVNVDDTLEFLSAHLKVVFLFGFIANVFVFLLIK